MAIGIWGCFNSQEVGSIRPKRYFIPSSQLLNLLKSFRNLFNRNRKCFTIITYIDLEELDYNIFSESQNIFMANPKQSDYLLSFFVKKCSKWHLSNLLFVYGATYFDISVIMILIKCNCSRRTVQRLIIKMTQSFILPEMKKNHYYFHWKSYFW